MEIMVASFLDELTKIAENVMFKMESVKAKQPKIGFRQRKLKTELKSTNYTTVNTQKPEAAHGTAASKAVPPPPVRT